MADQPLAVIDIGSNSGRVVVVELSAGHLATLADGRVPLRLAAELRRGRLGGAAIERTVVAVRDFAAIATAAGAAATVAVATSAVRESANAEDLIARIRRDTGIDVEIISGDQEARASFRGAVNGLAVDRGMLVDVGGGSVEVSVFRDRRPGRSWTLPLGALRLSQTFLQHDPPSAAEVRALCDHVSDTLHDADVPVLGEGDTLVGTGGTVRALAKLDRNDRSWPIPLLHGYSVGAARLASWAESLRDRSAAKRARLRGLSHDRADSIAAGALALATIVHHAGADEIVVAGHGLREGIALERLGAPMLPAREARFAAVDALAARFATWRPEAAARRAAIAETLRAAAMPAASGDAVEMLRHAAVLLDIGRAVRHYGVEAHAVAVITSADLIGFTHRHLAFIAAVLLAGQGGAKPFRRLLPEREADEATMAGCLLAIARRIEYRLPAGHPGTIEAEVASRDLVVRASVPAGHWVEAVSEQSRAALGRSLVIETEDSS